MFFERETLFLGVFLGFVEKQAFVDPINVANKQNRNPDGAAYVTGSVHTVSLSSCPQAVHS